jgi:nucleoside 2-deoxyribosyltransferase
VNATTPRIYLAGPDVFLPDAVAVGEQKSTICQEFGLDGVFPLDNDLALDNLSKTEQARQISLSNEALMHSCSAVVANMTPFRGAGMDTGTAFEMGFMRALGRPVFGYTNAVADFADRARAVRQLGLLDEDFDGEEVDIENFGLAENLMLAVAVSETGPDVLRPRAATGSPRYDLSAFRQAVAAAADYFHVKGTA